MAQSTGGGSDLPSGFTACDYIAPEVGATPYVRLGEVKNQQVRAFEAGVTMTGQATADDWQVVLGGCTNASTSFSIWANNSWLSLGGGAGGSANDRYYTWSINEKLIIKAENDLLYVNGNSVGQYLLSTPDQYWQYVCLFSRWTNGSASSQNFAGRIHYAKFYDANGVLLWDGVACRRDSDNKYGFYDFVSRGFFGKDGGNGEFIGQLL